MLFTSFVAKTAYQARGTWLLASDPRDLINKCVDITPGSCGVYYKLLMKQIYIGPQIIRDEGLKKNIEG